VVFIKALASGIVVNVADAANNPNITSLIDLSMVYLLMKKTLLLILIHQSKLVHIRNALQ